MKFQFKLIIFVLLILIPTLACGSESSPTSTPQISTATSSSATTEEVAQVEATNAETDTIEEVEPTTELKPTNEPEPTPELSPTDEPEPTPVPTDTPEPVQQEANLGDLVEQDGYSLAVVAVEDPAPPGLLYTPTDGTKLVAVEVIIGNVSGERITVNVLNSTLVDSEGFTYQSELAGRDGQISLADLLPGERVKGWVAFVIPEESEMDIFKYEVSGFPSIVLQTRLKTADGSSTVDSDVPLTATGDVEREVLGNLGDLVEKDGYSLVAETVEDPTAPGILYRPIEGKKLIAVQIIVGNVSGEVITVNVLNTVLVDTEGYVYMAELGGRDGQIELVDLGQGERVRGWVSFEIPENSTPESIKYQVSGFPLIELQTGLLE